MYNRCRSPAPAESPPDDDDVDGLGDGAEVPPSPVLGTVIVTVTVVVAEFDVGPGIADHVVPVAPAEEVMLKAVGELTKSMVEFKFALSLVSKY